MTPATKTPTLGRAEYEARRDMLTEELEAAQRSLDEAALEAATGNDVDGVLAELRTDRDAAHRAIEDLTGAWRASQGYQAIEASEGDARRRRQAYEASSQHLATVARLVAEIEATCLRLGDLVEEAMTEDQEARRTLSAIVKPGAMDPVPFRLVFDSHELGQLLEAVGDRYYGKRSAAVDAAAHSAARAAKRRQRFASMLGQEFTTEQEEAS